MTDLALYGIPTCDICKKALKALTSEGREVAFRDVRGQPLDEAEWDVLVAEFGDALVNRKSTTYRSFGAFLRESEVEAQLAAQPTVMKRPVIRAGDSWWLGWDETTQADVLAATDPGLRA